MIVCLILTKRITDCRPLPPYIVMERGEALNEWVSRSAPNTAVALGVIGHLMNAVAELHAAGYVHRDLKPSNAILLPSNNTWTLIDFGSGASIGAILTSFSVFCAFILYVVMPRHGECQTVFSDASAYLWFNLSKY